MDRWKGARGGRYEWADDKCSEAQARARSAVPSEGHFDGQMLPGVASIWRDTPSRGCSAPVSADVYVYRAGQ
eukprot:11170969-Lingulodinium_polyedra.AAC.1